MRAVAILSVLLASLVAVGTGTVGCGGPPVAPRRAVAVAQPLPPLDLPLVDGDRWSPASAGGKVLVIDVWASWCKPCRKAFPILDAFAARRPDVALVAISLDDELDAIRAFLAEVPTTVAVAHDGEQSLARAPLTIARLPTLLVVDAGGVVRYRLEEATESDYRDLDRLVDEVAAAATSAAAPATR